MRPPWRQRQVSAWHRARRSNSDIFYRAPWPSSEVYANWLIDQWNSKNGSRIHVTGASVDGETYKTKQTIELASSNPPDLFYSWEGGRGKEVVDNGFSADLTPYYEKYGWDKKLNPAGVTLSIYNGKKHSCRRKCALRLSGIARISTTTWL